LEFKVLLFRFLDYPRRQARYRRLLTKLFNILMRLIVLFVFLSSCTVSLNIVHNQGQADDVIDETQSPQNKPEAAIPLIINSF
jgi:hypothetical protein